MFSLGPFPVMTSYNNRGIGGGVFFVVCSRAILPRAPASQFSLKFRRVTSTVPSSVKLRVQSQVSSYEYSSEFRRVTNEYSGRAAVFREELQSCRPTDPAILEDRQPVKIQ
jgi:hypothetical protein